MGKDLEGLYAVHHRGPLEESVHLAKKESPTWPWSEAAREDKAKPSFTCSGKGGFLGNEGKALR